MTPSQRIARITAVMRDPRLNGSQRLIYIGLILDADRNGRVRASTAQLQLYAAVKRRETVCNATREMFSELDCIIRTSGAGQVGTFELVKNRFAAYLQTCTEKPSGRCTPRPTASGTDNAYRSCTKKPDRGGTDKADRYGETVQPQPVAAKEKSPHTPLKANNNNLLACEYTLPRARKEVPHLNGVGFVISTKYDLVIPCETIEKWRKRFQHLPDLEAAMQRLSAVILSKGHMYPGWQQPEAWMAGCLAKDNAQAEADARVTSARLARADGSAQRKGPDPYASLTPEQRERVEAAVRAKTGRPNA